MKIRKFLEQIKEEFVGEEELESRQDLGRFKQSIVAKITSKFPRKPEYTTAIDKMVTQWINDLNQAGFIPKIEIPDSTVADVTISVENTNVTFLTKADKNIGDKHSKTYDVNSYLPAKPQMAPPAKVVAPQQSIVAKKHQEYVNNLKRQGIRT